VKHFPKSDVGWLRVSGVSVGETAFCLVEMGTGRGVSPVSTLIAVEEDIARLDLFPIITYNRSINLF